MELTTIEPTADAAQKWRDYVEAEKLNRKEKRFTLLKKAYYQLKEGKRLLNVFEAVRIAGKNERDQPRFALAPASLRTVFFVKRDNGSGSYQGKEPTWKLQFPEGSIVLPEGTFPKWESDGYHSIRQRILKAVVPPVPPNLIPARHNLDRLFILWEVESWSNVPPKDPVLLKRVTKNLFVVLGQWDLTPLERAVLEAI